MSGPTGRSWAVVLAGGRIREADSRLESASALCRLAVLRALHVCEFSAVWETCWLRLEMCKG